MARLMGDKDTALVVNALRTSARQYDKDADLCSRVAEELTAQVGGTPSAGSYEQIAQQFRAKARLARELADRLKVL